MVWTFARYWCMRYEAKHSELKLRAQVVHKFKNAPQTLVRISQCGQSAKWGAKDVKKYRYSIISAKTKFVRNTLSREELHRFNFTDANLITCCTSVKVNGVEF